MDRVKTGEKKTVVVRLHPDAHRKLRYMALDMDTKMVRLVERYVIEGMRRDREAMQNDKSGT